MFIFNVLTEYFKVFVLVFVFWALDGGPVAVADVHISQQYSRVTRQGPSLYTGFRNGRKTADSVWNDNKSLCGTQPCEEKHGNKGGYVQPQAQQLSQSHVVYPSQFIPENQRKDQQRLTTTIASDVPSCKGQPPMFPHPTDCGAFYHCANNHPYLKRCGPGTHFNPSLMICDWPNRANCIVQTTTTTPSPPVVQCVNREPETFCNTHHLRYKRLRMAHSGEPNKRFIPGETIYVECDPGFILQGPFTSTCQIDGKWSALDQIACIRGCVLNLLFFPKHLRVNNSKEVYSEHETVEFFCDPGYQLKHGTPNTITCNPDKTSGTELFPECEEVIQVDIQTESGEFNMNQYARQKKSTGSCNVVAQQNTHIKYAASGEELTIPCSVPYDVNDNIINDGNSRWRRSNYPSSKQTTWMKEQLILERELGRSLPSRQDNFIIDHNGVLIIPRMDATHEGLYTCLYESESDADGALEFRSIQVRLRENCEIDLAMEPMDTVVEQDAHTMLRCFAPNSIVTWYKGNDVINGNGRIKIMPNGAVLIQNAQMEDSGYYTCYVIDQSTGCHKNVTITVEVTGEPSNICGKAQGWADPNSEDKKQGKIVGGKIAKKNSHPWVVLISREIINGSEFVCGGNLLTNQWVITAAHCFNKMPNPAKQINLLTVKLGKHNRVEYEQEERVYFVDELIIHPQFERNTFDNDLALLKLKDRVIFSSSIMPICLPFRGQFNQMQNLRTERTRLGGESEAVHVGGIVSGWGQVTEKGLQATYLKQVHLPLQDPLVCRESTKEKVTNNMFCAGYQSVIGDSCQGDSGGPYEIKGEDKRSYLLGLVSWGEGCARKGTFGFYTKLENYLDFIQYHIKR